MTEFDQQYAKAVALQMAGQDAEAVALYREILDRAPGHAAASHNLGMFCLATGEGGEALERVMNAVESSPAEPQFWISLIKVLQTLGEHDHVPGVMEQAAAAGLGASDLAALRLAAGEGQLQDVAVDALAEPAPDTLADRIHALLKRDRLAGRSGLRKLRGPTASQVDQAIKLFQRGDFTALEHYAGEMSRRHPQHPTGWHLLGIAQQMLCTHYYGLEALIKAVGLKPADAEYFDHLASALEQLGKPELAAACFARGLELAPTLFPLLLKYAQCEIRRGNAEGAEILTTKLCDAFPNSAEAHYLRGLFRSRSGQLDDAIQCFERSIALNPALSAPYQDLGLIYFNRGNLEQAIALSRKAVEQMPGNAPCFSNMLFFASHDEHVRPEDLFELHREYSRRYEAPLRHSLRAHENDPQPGRKLRIGFVSADFYGHAVASFIIPILERMNRSEFDLFGFCNNAIIDDTTRRIESLFKYWLPITHVTDAALADIVRACKIDILIDLSGHTGGNRLLTFARKPAPLQATWVGYADTTGLCAMDYYITDRFIAPPGRFDHLYTEKLLYLDSAAAFSFPVDAPDPGIAPVSRNGHLTFGSFSRPGKITAGTLDLWGRLLCELGDAHMLLGSIDADATRKWLLDEFARRGVGGERLRFMPRVATERYLAAHAEIDVLLDTFPFNVGTTAFFSVWMGVPILTVAGQRMVSNLGASIMAKAGLPEFGVESEERFIELARELAVSPSRLVDIRKTLRARIDAAGLLTADHVTRCVEKGLREVWMDWCAHRPEPGHLN